MLVRNVASYACCFVALGGAIGCAAPAAGEATEAAEPQLTTDQVGTDARVLQIWTPGRAFPLVAPSWTGPGPSDVSVDAGADGACLLLRAWAGSGTQAYDNRELDCTQALGRAAPFEGAPGPVMTPVRFVI